MKYVNYDIVFQEIPDEVTLAVNISNCPNRCPDCHSKYLWENIGTPLTEETLAALISPYSDEITCVCFMGGDATPREVERLAQYVRRQYHAEIKTAWYSGKCLLPDGFDENVLDYLKLGPFITSAGGLRSPHTNQRLYHLHDGEREDITFRMQKAAKSGV